jgi:hypothetical protein
MEEMIAPKDTDADATQEELDAAVAAKDASVTESKITKKRKRKALKKAEGHVHESVGRNKALRYLERWDKDRGEWKFEKCRQIWLLQNCYEPARIGNEKFDILLKYVASIQGKMRDSALEAAKAKVAEDDAWEKELEAGKTEADLILDLKKTRQPTGTVQRARDLVEMLE